MPPDGRPRYRHSFRCRCCGTRFHVTRLTADPNRVKIPRCPKKGCDGKVKQSYMADVGMVLGDGVKAPAVLGAPQVRAYDIALEAAAHNAGLTNLNDHPRYGESSVPRLPPNLQHKVDNFWGTPKRTVTKRVDLSGMFGQRALDAQQASPIPGMTHHQPITVPIASEIVNRPGAGPPVNIIAGDSIAPR